MKYIIKLTKKAINKTIKTLLLSQTPIIMNENQLEQFWNQYKIFVQTQKLIDTDWVTAWWAGKNSSLDRRIISKLCSDGIIRQNSEKKCAMPDVRLVEKFLNYFESAKSIEIIKETDITGRKKYLLTDFQASSKGKTIPEYQMELVLRMFIDLFSNFYNITPKKDIEIPKMLKTTSKEVEI